VETEPNDGPERASKFVFIPTAPGSPLYERLVGELSGPADRDWVVIPAQMDLQVRRLEVAPVGDADVAILWAAGPRAVTDLAGPGEAEVIENLAGSVPVTLAIVTGGTGDQPGRYEISVSRSQLHGSHIGSESGSPETLPLAVPGQVQGLFSYRGDEDTWSFEAKSDAVRLEYAPAAGVASRVVLRRGGDTVEEVFLAAQDAPRPLVWPNLGAGAYTVSVALQSDVPGSRKAYAFRAVLHPPAPEGVVLEVESGGVTPTAIGDRARVLGYLHNARDIDRFVQEPGPQEDDVPWVLRAGFAKGDSPARLAVMNGPDPVALGAKVVCNRIVRPGPIDFTVSAGTGEGELVFPVRYQLGVELRRAKDEEIEPNQGRATATKLPLNSPQRGFLHPEGDRDFWVFVVPRPPKARPVSGETDAGTPPSPAPAVAFSVRLTSPGVDAKLAVLDEDGATVARTNRRGEGGTEKIEVELPAGRYFVSVSPALDGASSCGKAYTLQILRK
jgi:hypothetical protein